MKERRRTVPAPPLLKKMEDGTPYSNVIIAKVRLVIVRDDSPAGEFERKKLGGGIRPVEIPQIGEKPVGIEGLHANDYLCIEVDGKLVPIAKGGCSETSFPQPIDLKAQIAHKVTQARKKLGLDP